MAKNDDIPLEVQPPSDARRALNERALGVSDTPNNLGSLAARGSTIALLSHGIFVTLQIVQLVILSRLLTPDDFGIVGMAMAITGFIRLFQDMGLTSATIQRRTINQDLISALFFLNLIVGLGLMLLCWLAAPVAGMIFSDDRVPLVIVFLSLTMPMLALRAQHLALVSRRMEFLKLNLGQLVSNIGGVTAACMTAWQTDLGYWSLVVGQLTTGFIDVVYFWIASRWRPTMPRRGNGARSAFNFGIKIMMSNILGWVWKQSDNALIGWRWGSVELGYYARAYSILLMPLAIISGPIGSAVIPALSRMQDNVARWEHLFTRTARIVAALSALLAAVLYVNATFLVALALGSGWEVSGEIFAVLALSILPGITWELARFAFLSLGRSDVMLKYSIVAGPAYLAGFIAGLPWGGIGVAWALAAVSWALAIPTVIVTARTAKISSLRLLADLTPPLAGFLLALGLAATMPAFSQNPFIETFGRSVLVTIVFGAVTLLSGLFNTNWRRDMAVGRDWIGQRAQRWTQ
ncbi:lipopolysaccharide biosynthesis protein [Erythrobacter sp. MTPC3]|uniref:lipopolysaccharide biosynthesis protein n=1 Tax=Erythrobacter sp. MTPC3 TaxID=3056564 RepID=UPI0036F259A9